MAVVLGNYVANKTMAVIDATIEHQIKIDTIKKLVNNLDKQVEINVLGTETGRVSVTQENTSAVPKQ